MSLPGLGLDEPEEVHSVGTRQHELAQNCEWRFEVAVGKYVEVKLLRGTAELFGTELVVGNAYTLTGTKAAIFTWQGCSFEVGGDPLQSDYTAEETPMGEYVNVHYALEGLRERARQSGRGDGPRVLILGPENAGKTTLAKILTAYASRSAQRSPVVVNLDTREGLMSLPGTLTATVFKSMVDVEEGWGTAPMSGPNGAIPVKLPLVYFFGSPRPEEKDGKTFKAQVGRLALSVQGRVAQDAETRESGLIIDTPGSLTTTGTAGYGIIQDIVSEFAVSAIVCLGSERLYSDMVKRFDGQPTINRSGPSGGETISVVKLAKSGGCVDRDETFMQAFRAAQIKTYFYGNPRLSNGVSLQPRQQQVEFAALTVWRRVGTTPDPTAAGGGGGGMGEADDDDDFLPGGMEDTTSRGPGGVALPSSQIYERLSAPLAGMRSSVLAVINCDPEADQDVIRDSSVMGFLYVTDTDEAQGRISLLSPVAGRVPHRAIVWSGWPPPVLGMDRS